MERIVSGILSAEMPTMKRQLVPLMSWVLLVLVLAVIISPTLVPSRSPSKSLSIDIRPLVESPAAA